MSEPSPAPRAAPGVVAARLAAAALLLGGTLLVLRPFLVPLVWAAILVVVTWPLYRRLSAATGRPQLAAGVMTGAVAVLVGIPFLLLLGTLVQEVTDGVAQVLAWRESGSPLPSWLTETELGRRGLDLLQRSGLARPEAAGEMLGRVGTATSRGVVALAGGFASNLLKFGVTLVAQFAFYANGERILALVRRLAPLLFPVAPAQFVDSVGESIQAVLYGIAGTAIVQGIAAGCGMAVAGVPSPVALGTATALTAVLPGGGSAVSLMAAAWLGFAEGRWLAAAGLAAWAVLFVSSIDNVLRPLLISGRAPIPFILVFLGILGGLAAFGTVGVFLGPVLLSVSFTLLRQFARIGHARIGEPVASADDPDS